ncbi:MAG TPA: DUF4159 domain-containing protein [Vicinamibacterales bacterium]|nr:DUF4159 domain-containing protein [Vicinamibacterales bacterium]
MRGLFRRWIVCMAVSLLALGTVAAAQRGFRGFGGFRGVAEGPGVPPRFPAKDFRDGAFTACKLMYTSDRREAGGVGWATDYPFAAINLMTRLSELTKIHVSRDSGGDVNYWVMRLTDPALFDCPFLMGSDVGTASFSDDEVKHLREYLLKGGFLWVDDFWGDDAWEQWASQIHRALPEFQIVDVPSNDAIRTTQYTVDDVEQVSSINFWRRGNGTRERGDESPHADFREIVDSRGHIMVAMTHNTDIGDSMEREGEEPEFFAEFSPKGYALATNIVLYALTH